MESKYIEDAKNQDKKKEILAQDFEKMEIKSKENENIVNFTHDNIDEKSTDLKIVEKSNENKFQPTEIIMLEHDSDSFENKNLLSSNKMSSFGSQNDDEEKQSFKETEKLKIVLLGGNKVGKTSIISKYFSNSFKKELDKTIDVVKYTKTVVLKDENKSIIFEILDTPSQEIYKNIKKDFYDNANVIILVYDINNEKSLEEIKNYWILEAEKYSNTKTCK